MFGVNAFGAPAFGQGYGIVVEPTLPVDAEPVWEIVIPAGVGEIAIPAGMREIGAIRMPPTVIQAGDMVIKDPADRRVAVSNWDDELADGVELLDEGTFTVTAITPREDDPSLEVDEVAFVSGNRKVRFRLVGGRRGTRYNVAHLVETDETPPQRFERSFEVMLQDL